MRNPAARLRQQIRRVGHRLHTARDHDLRIAGLDGLRGQRHSAQPRAADHVHRHRAHLRRQSAEERSLARRILPQPRRDHVAHDALVNLLRPELRALAPRRAPQPRRVASRTHRRANPEISRPACGQPETITISFHILPFTNSMREPALRIQWKIPKIEDPMHDAPTEFTPPSAARAPRVPTWSAPWWHTALIALLLGGGSVLTCAAAHRDGTRRAPHAALSLGGIAAEWILFCLSGGGCA